MKNLFILILCITFLFLNCLNKSNDKDAELKPKVLVGIISLKNLPAQMDTLTISLKQVHPNVSLEWINLLGKKNASIENGIHLLVQNNCDFIISPDPNLTDLFFKTSHRYLSTTFVVINPVSSLQATNNFFPLKSVKSLKNLISERCQDLQ